MVKEKKLTPISERARALTEEIAALEAQIKRLDSTLDSTPPAPRLRSTALPHGAPTVDHPAPPATTAPDEPIFEEVNQNRLKARSEPAATPDHFNDLGVRKYDLAAFLQRVKNHFRGPPTMNPKLVNYLAAGSIQGLRPMRYEKRVARNRFLFFTICLLALLVGILVYMHK